MESVLEATGHTPLLKLERGLPAGAAVIYAKLERFNPSVSIKDRAVRAMVDAAEARGDLKPDGTILEAVAGNTGIALAHICNIRGYGLILTMPEDYMPERRHVLECFGTQIETTPATQGVRGAIEAAEAIKAKHPDYCMLDHFNNLDQVEAHRKALVPEILEDLAGRHVDAFVGCVGTGASLTAIAERLRSTGTQIVAVEPAASSAIPGIAFGIIPDYLNDEFIDRRAEVTDREAVQGFRSLAAENGVLAGLSSGANYHVAKQLAVELGEGKTVLTIFYDGGERYFSEVSHER